MEGRNININTILIDLCMKIQATTKQQMNSIQTSGAHANWLQNYIIQQSVTHMDTTLKYVLKLTLSSKFSPQRNFIFLF